MKTAPAMQDVIARLARKHAFDLDQGDRSLVLHLDGFMPLVIERIAPNQVAVCHYYKQEGDVMRDPEVVFFTGYGAWVPMTFEQSPALFQVAAAVSNDGRSLAKIAPNAQKELASFCRLWASNLKAQGWLTHSRPAPDTSAA